jgi:hypothetical protein
VKQLCIQSTWRWPYKVAICCTRHSRNTGHSSTPRVYTHGKMLHLQSTRVIRTVNWKFQRFRISLCFHHHGRWWGQEGTSETSVFNSILTRMMAAEDFRTCNIYAKQNLYGKNWKRGAILNLRGNSISKIIMRRFASHSRKYFVS